VILVALLLIGVVSIPMRTSGSDSFSEDIVVNSTRYGEQRYPHIAVDGEGTISVTWRNSDGQEGSEISYSRSTDGGTTFEEQIRVGDNASVASDNVPRVVAGSIGEVFVVWADDRNGTSQIYISVFVDGTSFSPEVPLAPSKFEQVRPDATFANGTLYVVWAELYSSEPGIHLACSIDGGESFSSPIRVDSTGNDPTLQAYPRVAAVNDSVFVVWHDTREDPLLDIYGALSLDAGGSFGEDFRISDGSAGTRQEYPVPGFLPGERPCVAWQDNRDGDFDIRFSSSDGGDSFSASTVVTDGPEETDQTRPSMAVDSAGSVSIAFQDDRVGISHIFYALSRDLGRTFTPNMRVDSLLVPSEIPDSKDKCELPGLVLSPTGDPMIVFEGYVGKDWDIRFSVMSNEPPYCWIVYPSENEELEGETLIEANATDPDGDDRNLIVDVRIVGIDGSYDSGWLRAKGTPVWSYCFNFSHVLNGLYLIQARAGDGKSYSPIAEVEIVVSNAVQNFADLVITSSNITFSRDKMQGGDRVGILAEIRNEGNVDAIDVEVSFFRGDAHIGEIKTINRIAAGDKGSTYVEWTALEGKHTLRVVVDPENRIMELNEGNNSAAKQIDVKPPGFYRPDLEVSATNVTWTPSSPVKGDEVNMTVTIWNHGRLSATEVEVIIRLNGQELHREVMGHVEEGGSQSINIIWEAVVGQYELDVIIDESDSVDELNETNNEITLLLRVVVAEAFPGWYVGLAIAVVVAGAFLALRLRNRVR